LGSCNTTAMRFKFAIELLLFSISLNINGYFAGGFGTKDDPSLICDYTHLEIARNYLNTSEIHFRHEANIDLKTYCNRMPIGGYNSVPPDNSNKCCSHYDGGGFIISNLTIDSPNMSNIGRFPLNFDLIKLRL
jgi:hypothetical protein